jgi:NAD+ kinase
VTSVGIVANCRREAALECAKSLSGWLAERALVVRLASDLAEVLSLSDLAAADEALGSADLVIALGGDGTLLAANRLASPYGTPILGIHAGGPASFGFLTETTPSNACEAVEAVLDGRYGVESRMMVSAEVCREGERVAQLDALNEMVLRAQLRMLKMRVEVSGTYIATYAADGIIVATPTGSTAYNLAAGGPLVHPAVESLLITPICPHTLNVRTLLVDVHHPIRVTLEPGERDVILLTVDGQTSFPIEPGDDIRFTRSEQAGRFVSIDGANFYKKVQTRLRLGERFGSQ